MSGKYASSHFSDDLDSAILHNDELPMTVRSRIQSCLFDAEEELATAEEEISRAESLLDDFRSQHVQITTRIQRYREVLAPHRKIPDEILGEIFTFATSIVTLPPKAYQCEAPWNISHVCSKWRHIVHSTATIWNVISVTEKVSYSMYRRSAYPPIRSALFHSGHSFIVLKIHLAPQTFFGYRPGSHWANDPIFTIIPYKDKPNSIATIFPLYWDHTYQIDRDFNVISAVTRSGSLSSLRIDIPVPAPDIETIVGHAPSLDTFHIPNGNPFAISTLAKVSCGTLLPQLTHLSCMLTRATQDAYFDMLENRRAFPCTDISSVDFYLSREGLNRNVEREEIFKNFGWKITIYPCTGADYL